jgi:hydroxymethylglutaryl-CoA reductase (NADPH)
VTRGWIGHVPTSASTTEMAPLWAALANHAAPMFATWADAPLVQTHAQLVNTIADWWPALEALPRTLIHNDFNARNVAIRHAATGDRLVAYDWELATIGAPQRDLAEFLCFALPPEVNGCSMSRWIERHRIRLERSSGRLLCRERWHDGFRSALADVLITRLAFYALIHRVRPQTFLPRVVATWYRLYQLTTTSPGRRLS